MMRIKTIAKVILFFSLGLFLAGRLLNGTLSYYIHPRFNILTAVTAIGFVAVGIVYALQNRQLILTGEEEHEHQHELHEHEHSHHPDHDHSHDHDHSLSWIGLVILALPVVFGLLVRPQPLGANALANREINVSSLTSAQAPQRSELTTIETSGRRNILDWLYAFQRSTEMSEFNGEEVHVIGFVYRDDNFQPAQFMVSRFTVSCCVADAAPIGLIVQWPQAPDLLTDEWVEVRGTIQLDEFNGMEIPLIIADEVAPTDTPAQPYLFQ